MRSGWLHTVSGGILRKAVAVLAAMLLYPVCSLPAAADGVGKAAYRLDVTSVSSEFVIPYHGLRAGNCFRLVSKEPELWAWNGRPVYDGEIVDGQLSDGFFAGIPLPEDVSPGEYAFDIMVGYAGGGLVCWSAPMSLKIRVLAPDSSMEKEVCSGDVFRFEPECLAAGKGIPEKYRWTRTAVEGVREPAASGTGKIAEVLTNTTQKIAEVTYIYVVTDDPCYADGSIEVKVKVKPRISLEVENATAALCHGETTDIRLSPEDMTFRWEAWADGVGGATDGEGSVIRQTLFYEDVPGVVTYRIMAPDSSCMTPVVVGVDVNPLPEITLEPYSGKTELSLGQPVEISAWPDDYNHYTFTINGRRMEQTSHVLLDYDWLVGKDNRVEVRVASADGCVDSASMVFVGPGLLLPNVISLNGDGINDVLMPGYELEVFNRHGSRLYKGKDGWNGYYMGKRVPPATYLYVVKYVTPDGVRRERKFYVRVD